MTGAYVPAQSVNQEPCHKRRHGFFLPGQSVCRSPMEFAQLNPGVAPETPRLCPPGAICSVRGSGWRWLCCQFAHHGHFIPKQVTLTYSLLAYALNILFFGGSVLLLGVVCGNQFAGNRFLAAADYAAVAFWRNCPFTRGCCPCAGLWVSSSNSWQAGTCKACKGAWT